MISIRPPSPARLIIVTLAAALITVLFAGCTGMPIAGGSGLGLRSNGNITVNVTAPRASRDATAIDPTTGHAYAGAVNVIIAGNSIGQDAEKTVDAGKIAANPSVAGQGTASTTGAADVGGQTNSPAPPPLALDPQLAARRAEAASLLAALRAEAASLLAATKADAAVIHDYRQRLPVPAAPVAPEVPANAP